MKTVVLRIIYFALLIFLALGIVQVSFNTAFYETFDESCHDQSTPYRYYDFCLYYDGAKIAASDDEQERAGFYSPAVQHKYLAKSRSTDPMSPDSLVMQYAPFVPVVLAPWAMLPGQWAFDIYLLGSYGSFIASCLLLLKLRRQTDPAEGQENEKSFSVCFKAALLIIAMLGTVPVFVGNLLGQMSNFLFLFACGYFFSLHNRKEKSAGFFLALSSFKPHYALFLAVPALSLRRWQVLITAAAVELAFISLAACRLGINTVLGYPASLLQHDNQASCLQVAMLMINLRGLLIDTGFMQQAFGLALPAMALALVFLSYLWLRSTAKQDAFLMSATIILSLFFSPHSYIYDAVLLLIPALLCCRIKPPDASPIERSMSLLLLLTPYLQWLGMALLPINYHRSLPTAVILFGLSLLTISSALGKRLKKTDPVN